MAILVLLLPLFAWQRRRRGGGGLKRVVQDGGSVLLSQWIMEYGYWLLTPVVALSLALNLHPSSITLCGLALVGLGSCLVAVGQLGLGGVLLVLGATADMVDGVVARRRQLSSEAGEFVDAVADRYGDMLPFAGLAIYYGAQPLALTAVMLGLLGSVGVSYARAKAESLGVHDAPRGTMRRAERAVYLSFGTLLAPVLSAYPLVPSICTVIGLGANISALQICRHTSRTLRARG